MSMLPRSTRFTRRNGTSNNVDRDEEYHFRLLSGKVARENKAKNILLKHVNAKATSTTYNTNTDSNTPLLSSSTSIDRGKISTRALPMRITKPKKHSSLYRLLSGRSRKTSFVIFNRLLAILIVINVCCFVLESIPEIGNENSMYYPWFYGLEAFSSSFFLLEYIARVYTSHESKSSRTSYPNQHCTARCKYIMTTRSIIDLISCTPFFIELFIPGGDLPTFTWIRLFRLFRILKSEKSVRAFSSVYRVIWYNSEILGVALFIGMILMMATSTLLWYLQPPKSSEQFESIPATFYLSILMLTGQGTPDGVLPWYTKVIVMLTAVFSVPIFVIPSSMLTWGFEAEAERLMRRKRDRRRKIKLAKKNGDDHPESSSSSDDNEEGALTEDEDNSLEAEYDEYEDVVLGDLHENDETKKDHTGISDEDRQLIKDVSQFFSGADSDNNGSLSIIEFYKYQKDQIMKNKLNNNFNTDMNNTRLTRIENKLDDLMKVVTKLIEKQSNSSPV
jgi:voltage-gated potassium channel